MRMDDLSKIPNIPDKYVAQIRRHYELAKEWMAAHPESDAKVQFNYPESVSVIGVLSDGLEQGLVSANPDGLALLDYMGANIDDGKMPTIFMLRIALEFMSENPDTVGHKVPPAKCPRCEHILEVTVAVDQGARGPKAGDYTVCAFCQSIMRFDKDMQSELVEDKELADLEDEHPEFYRQLQDSISMLQKLRRQP